MDSIFFCFLFKQYLNSVRIIYFVCLIHELLESYLFISKENFVYLVVFSKDWDLRCTYQFSSRGLSKHALFLVKKNVTWILGSCLWIFSYLVWNKKVSQERHYRQVVDWDVLSVDSERSFHSKSSESRVCGPDGLDFPLNTELDLGIVPSPYIEECPEEIKVLYCWRYFILYYSVSSVWRARQHLLFRLILSTCGYWALETWRVPLRK